MVDQKESKIVPYKVKTHVGEDFCTMWGAFSLEVAKIGVGGDLGCGGFWITGWDTTNRQTEQLTPLPLPTLCGARKCSTGPS